jgi:hypothetical protein
MPADDTIKPAVVNALVKDGWTITHDPYRIEVGTDNLYADIGAERVVLGAERGVERIAVEIKSFLAASLLREFQLALGQFMLYRSAMRRSDPERKLVVAVSETVYDRLTARTSVGLLLHDQSIPFVIVRLPSEEVVRWTS